jgi:hypothetical protein
MIEVTDVFREFVKKQKKNVQYTKNLTSNVKKSSFIKSADDLVIIFLF